MKYWVMKYACLFFILTGLGRLSAQTISTKGTKILLVVDSRGNRVDHLILFQKISERGKSYVLKRYAGSLFYVGYLEGDYEERKGEIIPKKEARITMYTESEIFNDGKHRHIEVLSEQDYLYIGNQRAEVISRRKGTLSVKT